MPWPPRPLRFIRVIGTFQPLYGTVGMDASAAATIQWRIVMHPVTRIDVATASIRANGIGLAPFGRDNGVGFD